MHVSTNSALIEPVVIPDTFVCGLHNVEELGDGVYRFTFFATQTDDRICVARLVLSTAAIYHAAMWALRAIGTNCCGKFLKGALH